MRAQGVSISANNNYGPIDWALAAKSGLAFVFFRLTAGKNYVDPYTLAEYGRAKGHVLRGFYHFWRWWEDPAAQAAHHADQANKLDRPELGYCLDVEPYACPQPPATVAANVRATLDEAARLQRAMSLIYTGRYVFQDEVGRKQPWAQNYGLYHAQYPGNYSDLSVPTLADSWTDWRFWQWTEDGQVNGIPDPDVTREVYNGTKEQLYIDYGLPQPASWAQAIDAWARTQGYAGPAPE